MSDSYDLCILGGGPGGYVSALRASQLGASVALVEKDNLGGVCLNWGCIPTKTYLKHAEIIKYFQQSSKFGIEVEGNVKYNWDKMKDRKNKVVNKLTSGVEHLLSRNNVDIYNGKGRVKSSGEIEIQGKMGKEIHGDNIIIASGSKPFLPEVPGIDKENVITSKEVLDLSSLPDKLLIIGGGVIGVEMAEIFNSIGVEVIIVEIMQSILPNMDSEVASLLQRNLLKKNIEIRVETAVEGITNDISGLLKASLSDGDEIEADKVLIAAGREANLSGLADLNLIRDDGFIAVDDYYWTGTENIYAVGDVIGNYLLAHVAFEEGVAAVENVLLDKKRKLDYSNIPQCVYTLPGIASTGLREEEARKLSRNIKIGKFPFAANGKALAHGSDEGFVKVISDDYGEILGAHIFGLNSDELINEFTIGKEMEMSANYLGNLIHPHPSLSEAVKEAALAVDNLALHS